VSESNPTVAAISTPPGEGGIAVIRISGDRAFSIAEQVFRPSKNKQLSCVATHSVIHGRIFDQESRPVDEVLVTVLKNPKTYTGEDIIEISCHGGMTNSHHVLSLILQAGAQLAPPGEFTRRAFLNGKMDLTQAEAVADLIHAKTDRACRVASRQLEGALGKKINEARDKLMTILAHIEAHIDFPDEDISPDSLEKITGSYEDVAQFIQRLLDTAQEGKILRQGVKTVITGAPNVGKSSLFNLLLGNDRAIVTDFAGTTRDTLEEVINIGGVPFIMTDTAGIRKTSDFVEAEGIRRSQKALEEAEVVLNILDATSETIAPHTADPRFISVYNKCDLLPIVPEPMRDQFYVSAKTGGGVDDLKKAMLGKVGTLTGTSGEEVLVNTRHRDALRRAKDRLTLSHETLTSGKSLELVALDLRGSCDALGEIVGKTSTEDLLDRVFSTFCIGK